MCPLTLIKSNSSITEQRIKMWWEGGGGGGGWGEDMNVSPHTKCMQLKI